MPKNITLTLKQLAKFNGQNGLPAYIAFKGRIYDVSDSYFWRQGKHFVEHHAGTDLSEALKNAPHDASLLDRFPVVGFLKR